MAGHAVTRHTLLAFMRAHRFGVQSSASAVGAPQAAVVGFIVMDRFEVFFDTLGTTRKMQNLRNDPRIAFVIGGATEGEEETVQLEGVADEPKGEALAALKAEYFRAFPDGPEREAWPGITYVRVRPTWLRYSDFRTATPIVLEWTADQLAALD